MTGTVPPMKMRSIPDNGMLRGDPIKSPPIAGYAP